MDEIKSMAYVGNVTLKDALETKVKYTLYNYVDTPDLEMNELVRYVRKNTKRFCGF